jgi:hypothetical protein
MALRWGCTSNRESREMKNQKKRARGRCRGKSKRAAEVKTATGAASLAAENVRQKNSPKRKPVRIGDALRRSGLDEWTIAGGYVDVVYKLTNKSNSNDSVEKLLVDVLKECSRHLEPPRFADAPSDAPVIVKLVHTVSRPRRPPAPPSPSNSN